MWGRNCSGLLFCPIGEVLMISFQIGEECDDGNAISSDYCTTSCKNATCGDTYTQPLLGEQCDDGNSNNFDYCTNLCLNATCGDGFKQPGEACDDGNRNDTDACTNACTFPGKSS